MTHPIRVAFAIGDAGGISPELATKSLLIPIPTRMT